MAMRMPPQAAQTSVLPTVNRTSLVFFGGITLILLNFYWQNGSAVFGAIFQKNHGSVSFVSFVDTGLQMVGLAILALMAEYGGEGAGSFALVFLAALWLLWILTHYHTAPGGGSGGNNGGNNAGATGATGGAHGVK